MLHSLDYRTIQLAYLIRLRDKEKHLGNDKRMKKINHALENVQRRFAANVAAQLDIDNAIDEKELFD